MAQAARAALMLGLAATTACDRSNDGVGAGNRSAEVVTRPKEIAPGGQVMPGGGRAMPDLSRRFAYVFEVKQRNPGTTVRRQELRLADISATARLGAPVTASDVATIRTNVGDGSPEEFLQLVPSRKNTRLASVTQQRPAGAVDYNIEIHDMAARRFLTRFNEHSLFGLLNRAACPSSVLDREIAYITKNNPDIDKAELARFDYRLAIERPGILFDAPSIRFVSDGVVVLRWSLPVEIVYPGAKPNFTGQQEAFALTLDISGPRLRLLACDDGDPVSADTPSRFTPAASGPPAELTLDGRAISFVVRTEGATLNLGVRRASMAAGSATK